METHRVRDRRPALRQDEVGHVVRFDNRDLVAHGGHPRQVRQAFLGFRSTFFFSTTSIAFITPRPLWFAFASHASYNLTRCLMRATHSNQETQRSASVSRCATGSAPSDTGGKSSNTPRTVEMRGINGAPDLP